MERLSAQDLSTLWPDDVGWPQDIGALAILDGSRLLDSDGRFRIEAVRAAIEGRLHLVRRFRQLLYMPRSGLGWPLWVDAPTFDLSDHVRVFPLRSRPTRRNFCEPPSTCGGAGWTGHGRCGRCGSFPGCPGTGSGCS